MELNETISHWSTALSNDGHVQAWIILQRGAWDLLQSEKVITCPQSFAAADENFVLAYDWLRRTMESSGFASPGHDLTPWWCWVQREGDHPMPFREDIAGLIAPVVLELSLPAHWVAISCFDAWHWVLNDCYLYRSAEDEQEFEATLDRGAEAAEIRKRKETSWNQVFDLGQMFGTPTTLAERSLQGCFWQLRLEHVVRVVEALDAYPEDDDEELE
jgi:hypothetical protein